MAFSRSEQLHPSILPVLQLFLMLAPAAIASAVFVWRSELSRRLPDRYPGRAWIIWGIALQVLAVPILILVFMYADGTGRGSFRAYDWLGLPGLIAIVVGCIKTLLGAAPRPDGRDG
jgi:drug/metabolite transporter (DMT)-like permease